MKELEKDLKIEMKKDLQIEKEYSGSMEKLSKIIEEDVENVANIVENNNNILGDSITSLHDNDSENKKKEVLPVVEVTTDSKPCAGNGVERDYIEKNATEVSSSSPSLKRLKRKINTTALPSPLQRLQDFRKSLQGVVRYQSRSYETDHCDSKLQN